MKETYQLVRALERLRDGEDRARLASLRRGLGQPPGAVIETTGVVEHLLDEDCPPWRANALHLLAPLFALHPIPFEGSRNSNMGDHFHSLFQESADPPPNVERRFMTLLASEPDDLPDTLRQAVTLLKSKGVAVNWYRLLDDIEQWSDRSLEGEERRREVRFRWSRRFWRLTAHRADLDSQKSRD